MNFGWTKQLSLCSLTLFTVFSFNSFAVEPQTTGFELESDPYYQIASIETEVLDEGVEIRNDVEFGNAKSLPQVIAAVDGIIALGKKIWPIIEAGRPVSSARFNTVDVLPRDHAAFDLENWEAPKGLRWRVSYKNLYGMEVIGFTYAVLFSYGGSQAGKGKYISGAFVEASDVSVAWGFDFDATSEVVSITNLGTRANPVAGLTLKVNYRAKSVFKDINSQQTVFLTGRGQISEL